MIRVTDDSHLISPIDEVWIFEVILSSVASFLVLGGARPPNVPTKKNHVLKLRERAKRASASNIYFQDSKYICIHTINAVSFNNL